MSQMKLTQWVVDKLKAPTASGRPELYWDTVVTGLAVWLSDTSNVKTYYAKGVINGSGKRRKIGHADLMSLEQARAEAKRLLLGFASGIDPRQKRASAATLRQVLDGYLAARANLKPRSRDFYSDTIARHMGGWLDKPIGGITSDMVERRHRQIAADVAARDAAVAAQHAKRHLQRAERTEEHYPEASTYHRARWRAAKERKPRAGHAVADGAMRTLRALFNYAIDKDPTLTNPVRQLKKQWFKVERRQRLVKADDLAAFYEAVMGLENPIVRDYLRLLLFTGLRRRESARLRWDDVDLKARLIRVPSSSTKNSRKLDLPMSDVVADILIGLRRHGSGKFVFPSATSASGHVEEVKSALAEVTAACGVRVSPHDLRRTFISVAESCDISMLALKYLVNHAVGDDATAGYVVLSTERLREATQRVTDKLKQLCQVPELEGVTRLKRT
jgi:integrase